MSSKIGIFKEYTHIEDTFTSLSVGHCDHISVERKSVSDHLAGQSILKVEVTSHSCVVQESRVSGCEVDEVHLVVLGW